ncbi:hypothetical protein BO226_14050 [Rhodococcus sp. 2G]|nr:hypothetical protein BO226_14050 [Rhodococcus sp. 2G]
MSCTNFSPSRLDCSTLASAFAGRSTLESSTMPTSAVHPKSDATEIDSTRPTGTPSTFTLDCGTRSSTSSNWMDRRIGSLPTSAPPGNGTSDRPPHPVTVTATTHAAAPKTPVRPILFAPLTDLLPGGRAEARPRRAPCPG